MLNFSALKPYIRSLIFLFVLYLPTNLWANCQVTLQWNPNSESNVYYQLYIREIGSYYNYDNFVWQGPETHTTVDQLDESKTYYFVVRATDAQGNQSGDSNEAVFKYGDSSATLSSSGSSGGGSGAGCFLQTLMAH